MKQMKRDIQENQHWYACNQYLLFSTELPQGARKSAAKTATFRAPLALTVSIDLSASDGERDEVRVGKGGEGQKATTSGAVWTQVRRLFRLR